MTVALQKFTTEFIPEEDRLRLSCELEDGQYVVLWLTQRLLRRLVPHLCSWLEKQPVPVTAPASANAVVLEPTQVRHMAQQVAQASLHQEKREPVQAPQCALSGVVQTVHLQAFDGRLNLTLQVPEQAEYSVALAPTALRQWLGIVYRHHQMAQWPLELWPQWLREPAEPSGSRASPALLH